jgi:hypothetical protein
MPVSPLIIENATIIAVNGRIVAIGDHRRDGGRELMAGTLMAHLSRLSTAH